MRHIPVTAKYAALIVIPLISTFAALLIREATTPYFMFHHDPEYAYLFNGVSILHFLAPTHIDHPGTPLQLISAFVIKLLHPLSSGREITESVVANPERYLLAISTVLIGVNAIVLMVVGITTYFMTDRIWIAILMQSPPLLFNATTASLSQITPEPLVLSVSLLFGCLLLLSLNVWGPARINPEKTPKYFGLLSGFGIAVKLTFAPVLFAVPFVFHKVRQLKPYGKYILLGFFLSTLPLLLKFPLFVQYRKIIAWAYNLFVGAGIYGHGERTIINKAKFFSDLWQIILAQPLYSWVVLLAVATIVYGFLKVNPRNAWSDPIFRLLSGLVSVHILTLLLVGKHPQSDRYLVPAMGLAGLTMLLVFLFLREQVGRHVSQPLGKFLTVCAGTGIVAFSVFQANAVVTNAELQGKVRYEEFSARDKAVTTQYPECAQIHQDSGTQVSGVFFGLKWSRKSETTDEVIQRFFSGRKIYTYDPGRNIYYDMNENVVTVDDIRKTAPCVIKLGPGTELKTL